jgi:hypothetical protein
MFLLRQPGATSMPKYTVLRLVLARLTEPPYFSGTCALRGTSQDSSPTAAA